MRLNAERLRPHQRFAGALEIEVASVGELLFSRAEAAPERVLAIFPRRKTRQLGYAETCARVAVVAAELEALGLRRGDRLNLLLPNSSDFFLIYLAALTTGITLVPINPDLVAAEVAYIVGDCEARILIASETLRARAEEAAAAQGVRLHFTSELAGCALGEALAPEQEALAAAFRPPEVSPYDESVIIYTSGTTGNPKGVVLTHFNLVADAWAISSWFSFHRGTRTLCVLPLFHNNGQVVTLLSPLFAGGSTVIVPGKASLASFWGLVEKHQVTWTSVMPAILSILLHTRREVGTTPLEGIICGGQVLTRSVQEDFEQTFGVPIFEGFGLTETTSFACFNGFPAERRLEGVVGRPLPTNEMAILDEDGRELGPGEEGELCIRGLNVAKEYLGLREQNAAAFRGGWFHSGDFGLRREDGNYVFRGRKDSLIIKGGENVYPAELENVLFKHPAVVDCAVIGIPDPLLGQELCAFVKLEEGASLGEEELRDFCAGEIAAFKHPKEVLFLHALEGLDEIPKGPTKKVLYRKLVEYYHSLEEC